MHNQQLNLIILVLTTKSQMQAELDPISNQVFEVIYIIAYNTTCKLFYIQSSRTKNIPNYI